MFMLLPAEFSSFGLAPPAHAQAGSINFSDFPWITAVFDDDAIMLRFDGLQQGTFSLYELDFPPRIVLEIPGVTCDERNPVNEAYDFPNIPLIIQLRASCGPDGVRVVLESRYALHWEITSPEIGDGINLLCYLRFRQTVEEIALDDGTVYLARRYVTPGGQRFTHAIVSDSTLSRLRPRIVMARDVTSRSQASVNEIVTGFGGTGGINGGYFSWPGISLSLVIQNGQIKAPPMLHRPAFMVLENGSYAMDYPQIRGSAVSASGLRWDFDLVNQTPGPGQVALLTPGHPTRVRCVSDGCMLLIRDRQVVQAATMEDEVEDFSDCYVIWSRRSYTGFEMVSAGEEVEIQMRTDIGMYQISHAIQGGPFLVRNGEVNVTSDQDDIGRDIANGRTARTAIGFNNDGKLFLVTVEGSGNGRSMGATLQEMAWTLIDLGATWGMNLDGGSSTGMALPHITTQSGFPSGGRQIATAIVLYDESGYLQGEGFFF